MKKIALIVVLVFLAGCAGSGKIKWDNARQLQEGMTEKDVSSLMGKPYSVTSKADGTQIWVWVHVNGMMGSSQTLALPMRDGKVTSVPVIPSSF